MAECARYAMSDKKKGTAIECVRHGSLKCACLQLTKVKRSRRRGAQQRIRRRTKHGDQTFTGAAGLRGKRRDLVMFSGYLADVAERITRDLQDKQMMPAHLIDQQ